MIQNIDFDPKKDNIDLSTVFTFDKLLNFGDFYSNLKGISDYNEINYDDIDYSKEIEEISGLNIINVNDLSNSSSNIYKYSKDLNEPLDIDWQQLISYNLSNTKDFKKDLNLLAYLNNMFVLNDKKYLLIDFKDYDEKGISVMTNELKWLHYNKLCEVPEEIWNLLEDTNIFQYNVKNYNQHMGI